MGLGNPGDQYRDTRHNAGFKVVESLSAQWKIRWAAENKFSAEIAGTDVAGLRVILVRPTTYMNLSGESVGAVVRFHKVPPEGVLVVVDDADLPLGQLRMRGGGGAGGHHGLESVAAHLGTQQFARLRVGIGRADGRRDIAGFVLGKVSAEEAPLFECAIGRAAEQARCWLTDGLEKAMNQFNGPVEAGQKKDKT